MNTRREFLKSLLGVVLVAPAVAACQTIAPKPVVLPAEVSESETMVAKYRAAFPNHAVFGRMNHGKTYTGRLANHGVQSQNIPRRPVRGASHNSRFVKGSYQMGSVAPEWWLDYNRGPQPWLHTGPRILPHGKRTPWDTARYEK
jgi:hypothetical protein